MIQRSEDGGRTWEPVGNDFSYADVRPANTSGTTARCGRGSSPACGISNRRRPIRDTVWAGVQDAALFQTTDGGDELGRAARPARAPVRAELAAGRGRHVPAHDPARPERREPHDVAISAAGVFRTDDGGAIWRPINKGLLSDGIPSPAAEVGHCVHNLAMHPSRPDTLFMQKHWDVMRSDDGGENWHEISGNLPTDFGFPITVHAHEPETVYVVPITSDSHHFPPEGKLRVYRSRAGGNEWEALTDGLPQENCYVDILRDAMAVDTLDECGVYFGTTGGQVYASPDSGDTLVAVVRDLPPVLSVEVQTLT